MRSDEFRELLFATFIEMAEENFSPEIVIPKLRSLHGENYEIESFFINRKEFALEHLYDYIENIDFYAPDTDFSLGLVGLIDSYFNFIVSSIIIIFFAIFFGFMWHASNIHIHLTE